MIVSTTSTPTQEDWVLICQPRGASQSVAEVRLVQLRRNAKLALGQSKLSLGPLVGVPFGTNFLVEHSCRSGGLALVRDDRSVEELLGETGNTRERLEGASSTGGGAGSIEIDDGSAQRLDVQQIKRLKAESASGDSVVIAIAQGSRTFASKSSFAQVKYLRKKARKHMQFVSALRPTALALSDMYAAKAPEKLLCLRRDSLALLLSLGGLQPGARALVLEGSLGLLTAAASQRVGSEGRVLALHLHRPNLEALRWLNLSAPCISNIAACPLAHFLCCVNDSGAGTDGEPRVAAGLDSHVGRGGGDASSCGGVQMKPRALSDADARSWTAHGFTSLVIATREPPLPVLLTMLELLRPSCPFVLYHPSSQPLADCMHACQQARIAVRMQLIEPWTRSYQVEQNRTHPTMSTYCPTGYVLAGVRVETDVVTSRASPE